MDSKTNNLIILLAIVVALIALINFSVTFIKLSQFNEKITGYVTDYGYVNISITSLTQVSIYNDTVNWGAGVVNTSIYCPGGNATLWTRGLKGSPVTCGNWSNGSVYAMFIRNEGNTNVSLVFTSDKNATDLFGAGSTAARRAFQWNITNKETGACGEWNVTNHLPNLGNFTDVNTTGMPICNQFDYHIGSREIWIDTKLMVPDDVPTTVKGNVRGAMITVTANAL